jgi:hypothetical protein
LHAYLYTGIQAGRVSFAGMTGGMNEAANE